MNEVDKIGVKGKFKVELIRDGNVIETIEFNNTVMNEGKNKLLDVFFRNQTQIATWYIGLMDNAGYSANPVTDTMSSHAGWAESVAYSEGVRQTWAVDAAASQQIANGVTAATFSINATATLRGIFVASNSTKSGTTGTLWASALFPSTLPVANGDSVKITYTVAG